MDAAVIGAGFIGQLHRKAWEANGVPVKVMVDPYISDDQKRLLETGGVEVVSSIDRAFALYPDIQAISVCTPPGSHLSDLMKAADYGAAVLMEKPVAVNKEDYITMMQTAEEKNIKLMIGLTQRFYPEVRQAAAWIKEGKIGKPMSFHDTMILSGEGLPAWYQDRSLSGGGVYMTNGVHLLDRMQFMLDSDLSALYHADFYKDDKEFDYIADVNGCMVNGVPFHLHLEWSGVKQLQRTVIYGTQGRIELQTWQHATLYDASGDCFKCEPYRKEDTFADRTLRGLTLEIRTFMDGLRDQFPKGLTLLEHLPTMIAIWRGYGIEREA